MLQKLYIAALLTATCVPVWAIQQPVKTKGGLVSGVAGKKPGITAFKGIPFAAPPVGDLRWAPPKPAAPWTGVLKGDNFSASCIQTIVPERKPWTYEFMAHNEVSEDCLYLNVWTPAKSSGEKRPVYAHGTSNQSWLEVSPAKLGIAESSVRRVRAQSRRERLRT